MIGTNGKRESGKSVLAARQDDDDDKYILWNNIANVPIVLIDYWAYDMIPKTWIREMSENIQDTKISLKLHQGSFKNLESETRSSIIGWLEVPVV